jgi:chromosome segregation ATPase
VRETQEKRLRGGERRLAALGRINPLALEEFTALEERHTFLTTQLEDIKRSKRDLLDIIREVDERIERVFTEAYHDVAVQFERVFSRLFPGGEGRLILLLEELRDSSQLIVITHQKRTMEIADALYGVTMRGDGVTTVVSQRMTEVAGARSACPAA